MSTTSTRPAQPRLHTCDTSAAKLLGGCWSGGWQDIFLGQTCTQYRHLHNRGVDVALTIGPWTHTQLLTKGLGTSAAETLDWLDTHLRRAHAGASGASTSPA